MLFINNSKQRKRLLLHKDGMRQRYVDMVIFGRLRGRPIVAVRATPKAVVEMLDSARNRPNGRRAKQPALTERTRRSHVQPEKCVHRL